MDENLKIAVSAEHIDKTVAAPSGSLTILQDINLRIIAGSSVAIVGPSGSGKTTLLGLLAGLDLPSAGQIELIGQNISAMDEDQRALLRAQSVGFVFQSFHLLENLTALENVLLPMELADNPNASANATNLLSEVGLADRLDHYPNQLSGGEKQRVALARAFASQPKILFADEPTGNLDTATGSHIIDLMFKLNEDLGTTLVLVTHDPNLAERCDTQVALSAGRIVEESTA